ncbi:MAG: PD-(D/E)XK nuclease family protein [Thermodesulfobacteriota bacterium]
MTFFPPGQVWILPSGLAVRQARADLLERTVDGVILAPRVYSFKGLEAALSEEIGGTGPIVSELGQTFFLSNWLKTNSTLFRSAWGSSDLSDWSRPGLVDRIREILTQLRTGGMTSGGLKRITTGVIDQAKSDFLTKVLSDYDLFLNQRGLTDRAGVRRNILEALSRSRQPALFREVDEVSLRGFHRLTPWQIELTQALARTGVRVVLRLAGPPWLLKADPDHDLTDNPFLETHRLLRAFESTGDNLPNFDLTYVALHSRTGEDFWLDGIFRPVTADLGPLSIRPPAGLEIISCPGRYAEVEEIGRRITVLLEQGTPPENIAVAMRDLGTYGQLVEDVFRRFRLPLFLRRGAPLVVQTPVRTLLALLNLARSHWERDLLLDLLACPILDLGLTIPWVRAAQLSAQAGVTDDRAGGGWLDNLSRLAKFHPEHESDIAAILSTLDRLKKITAPLARERSWSDFLAEIRSVLAEFRIEEKIREAPLSNRIREAAAWSGLENCLAELEQAVRENGANPEPLPPHCLEKMLKHALAGRNVGAGAGGGGIMVLNIFDLHGLEFEHLFLAGMNEGEYPRPQPDGLFLDDAEIRGLNRAAGRAILTTVASEYRLEGLTFYYALASTGRRITLSYSRQDEEGRLCLNSSFLDELIRLWPAEVVKVKEVPFRVSPLLEEALTWQELTGRLALAGLGRDSAEDRLAQEVLAALNDHQPLKKRWLSLAERAGLEKRRREETGPFSGLVGPEILKPWLKQLAGPEGAPLISPTFLQTYAECPFLFWAKHVLGLAPTEQPEDEMPRRDEGRLLHEILKRFLEVCRTEKMLPLTGRTRELELLREISRKTLTEAEAGQPVGRRPLWRAKCRNIGRKLERWLANEAARRDDFVPACFEWSFGPGQQAPPLEVLLLSGERLLFRGRVDRVDLTGEKARVLDYKDSSNRAKYRDLLAPDNAGRTSFQAPLYLAAVATFFQRPTSAGWILLRDYSPQQILLGEYPDQGLFLTSPARRRELGQANFFNRLEEVWSKIAQGSFPPQAGPETCDYCDFSGSCRWFSLKKSPP